MSVSLPPLLLTGTTTSLDTVGDNAPFLPPPNRLLNCSECSSLGTRYLKVRKPTDFGFVLDDMGNMPAMEVDATRIRGTDATMEVRYAFGENWDMVL